MAVALYGLDGFMEITHDLIHSVKPDFILARHPASGILCRVDGA
jgi:hypothetical protein